jgi:hypothetical protein
MPKVEQSLEFSQETQRVLQWRYDWLLAAGYSHENANRLALRTDIDWRMASELLRKSENQEMALRILL